MPAAIDEEIKKQVVAQYLQGDSRDKIAAENDIGSGTVSNILDEWKRAVQGSDYESVRELAVHCKKEGIILGDLTSALRIRNYIKELGIEEERTEQFIARCANSQDPQRLVDVLEKKIISALVTVSNILDEWKRAGTRFGLRICKGVSRRVQKGRHYSSRSHISFTH